MKIGIITYQLEHQKTQDLLAGLMLSGYKQFALLALPFVARPQRPVKYQHRNFLPYPLHPEKIAKNIGAAYFPLPALEIEKHVDQNNYDTVLIAGAGLLPESLALNHQIINAHPGYLPKVKGLDSLKWAILNEVEELGVTTHFISDKADEGILIDRKIVPLYKEDSFHSFAQRQYQIVIQMLVEAVGISNKLTEKVNLSDSNFEATMRMPIRLEEEMMLKFEERRKLAPSMFDIK